MYTDTGDTVAGVLRSCAHACERLADAATSKAVAEGARLAAEHARIAAVLTEAVADTTDPAMPHDEASLTWHVTAHAL